MNPVFENASATNPVAGFLALTLAALLLIWRFEGRPHVPESRRARRPVGPRSRAPLLRPKALKGAPHIVRDPEQLARAALNSIEAVMAIADSVAETEAERNTYRTEVQDSVVALVSAIIMADGVVHSGECKFVRTLMKNIESGEHAQSIVAREAERWKELSGATPAYFHAIAAFDRAHQTQRSQQVLMELGKVVRCTGLADGDYVDAEFAAASSHLAQLEAVLKEATWVVQWDQADAQQRIAFERMYRRDEFGSKEVI